MESKSNQSEQHFHVAEVSTSVDEVYKNIYFRHWNLCFLMCFLLLQFQIRQTTYKVSVKLESTSGSLTFSTTYTNPAPGPMRCVRRSTNLTCTDSKVGAKMNGKTVPFSFYFELERNNKKQKSEIYNLYLKRLEVSGNNFTLLKHAVFVLCACEGNGGSNEATKLTKGNRKRK